jgi:O-antigen/teichoic acid export membrane protein
MYRQILGYIPANAVPAVMSFVMVYAFTRLLSPSELGAYNVAFSIIMLIQATAFSALQFSILRFYPAAALTGRVPQLLKVVYSGLGAISLAIILVGLPVILFLPLSASGRSIGVFSLTIALARAVLLINQGANRASNAMARYNLIECGHAVAALAIGLILAFTAGPTAASVLTGLLLATVLFAALDVRRLKSNMRGASFDSNFLQELTAYAWPLVLCSGVETLLLYADRFLLSELASIAEVGIYAVAFSLVERPMAMLCMSVSAATFPFTIGVLEREGSEAARKQTGRTSGILVAVTLPACVGLILCAAPISALMVGPAFRDGVAALIPIMAVTAMVRALASHSVTQSFHLGRRSDLLLLSGVPSFVASIAVNVLLIPPFGAMGAAWSALGCNVALLAGRWLMGRRIFPLGASLRLTGKSVVATAGMYVALAFLPAAHAWLGLVGRITLGGLTYSAILLLLHARRTLAWSATFSLRRRCAR